VAVFTITGGAGFIGSHLADALLAAGHGVRVIDDLSTGKRSNLDPRCELIVADIRDRAKLVQAMAGSAGCFHLAAIASVERTTQDWLGTHGINQTGSLAVLDVARELGTQEKGGLPVVYASSAAVYGDIGGEVAHEGLTPAPLTTYGVDKFGSELHARIGWKLHGVPSVGLRFFNVYGPRQDPASPYSGVISIFARLAGEGRRLMVHGDGAQTRDFVHVSDVAAHLMAAMRHARDHRGAHVFNVCTGSSITVFDLAREMLIAAGQDPARIDHGPARPGDIRQSQGDPTRAIAALGIAAQVDRKSGLARLLRTMTETPALA
jgi:UDP-glucose 4-epimerase